VAEVVEVAEAVTEEAVVEAEAAAAAAAAAAAPRLRIFSLAPDPLPPRQLPVGLAGSADSSVGGDGGSGDSSGAAAVAVAAAEAEAGAEAGATFKRRVCAGILRRLARRAGCAGWSLREWGDNERPSGPEAGLPCGACGSAELPTLFTPEGEAEPATGRATHFCVSSPHTHTLPYPPVHSRTPPYTPVPSQVR
jgi:hypothetical protein